MDVDQPVTMQDASITVLATPVESEEDFKRRLSKLTPLELSAMLARMKADEYKP